MEFISLLVRINRAFGRPHSNNTDAVHYNVGRLSTCRALLNLLLFILLLSLLLLFCCCFVAFAVLTPIYSMSIKCISMHRWRLCSWHSLESLKHFWNQIFNKIRIVFNMNRMRLMFVCLVGILQFYSIRSGTCRCLTFK